MASAEFNVTDFVRIKLSLTNYFTWRHHMLGFIGSQGLVGFINGEIKKPCTSDYIEGQEEIVNQDYEAWERSDSLLRSWIRQTIDEGVYNKYVNLPAEATAKEMWEALERHFGKVSQIETRSERYEEEYKDLNRYLPLHKAALKGDWEKARIFFERDPDAIRAIITERWETALIIASRSAQRNHFLKKLVNEMSVGDLALTSSFGSTALHIAAGVGNIVAAKLLVKKSPDLPHFWDAFKLLPLHKAAMFGRRKMVLYLLTVTKHFVVQKPFAGASGVHLVCLLIRSRLNDIALSLIWRYPHLASASPSFLKIIAGKRSAFRSGTSLNLRQQLIYFCIPLQSENFANHDGGDVEKPQNSDLLKFLFLVRQKLHEVFCGVAEILVHLLRINYIRGEKVIHHQALQLLKYLCKEVVKLKYSEACKKLGQSLIIAANNGIHEVVEEILESFPSAVYLKDEYNRTVFHFAIMNRYEKVFELIYQFEELSYVILGSWDIAKNNGLHYAGYLESRQSITRVPGAVLQMQRELQWFKEVEKLSLPQDKEQKNKIGKTPEELFNETHAELVKEGERWMRETANSCTIVAALVATVVFAAAITVPGGNNQDSGLPIFSKEKAFLIFGISDGLALFSSTCSMLIFLSILTSRYAQEDFLNSLPKKLIYGLVSLFLSIIFMMIAFGTTLYLVFGLKKAWILIPVAALAWLPVTLFASLQFSLLLDMIKSTYSSSIFCKKLK